MNSRLSLSLAIAALAPACARDAGILYEVWHTRAAAAMATVRARGDPQLTTELVIQSQDTAAPLSLDDVYRGLPADIWNAQPQLGFYCLWRARAGDPPPSPPLEDCANISATAEAHATMLLAAGFDYVAVDVTNWPVPGEPGGVNDVSVIRPTEVLFEEWLALRQRGVPTPKIAIWPCSPTNSTTWRYMLENLYNNASYADLVYTQDGKQVVFVPYAGANCWSESEAALIRENGGRNNVQTIPMWALFGEAAQRAGAWGFFSPCTDENGAYTTSMVGVGACNQFSTYVNGTDELTEISASGGYMTSQCALPFASPGHLRGLTVARLFEKVLALSPPHLFMSSYNEMIGGRQAPAYPAKVAINMGLPNDSQRAAVWVDTYAAEFSRDIEPTVEGGNRTWVVAASCVTMYKNFAVCDDAHAAEPCCSRNDKEVYANVWSMQRKDGGDFLLTALEGERAALIAGGAWAESCNAIASPSAFCVDSSEKDGRMGPFMLFNTSAPADYARGGTIATAPLYRCITTASPQTHFFSLDAACEGATTESALGFVQQRPGNEMLRALHRCVGAAGARFHALDFACDQPDPAAPKPLGYVR